MRRFYAILYIMSSGNPETRKRILETAWRLMVDHHGKDVWVDEIARETRLSRQSIYLYFKNRADLLIATVRYVDEVKEVNHRLEVVCRASDGVEIIDGLVEFWGNYIPEIYGLAKALLAVYKTDPDAAAAWDDRMKVFRDGCGVAVRQLQQEGRLAPGWDAETATGMMWSLLALQVWENLVLRLGWPNEAYIRRMKELMRRTFVQSEK